MTTADIIQYYKDLLVLQYRGKPKAAATIGLKVQQVIADQIYLTVQNGFDLESAVGVQLDIIGKYEGVTRVGNSFTGPVTLGDSDFLILIRLAILQNSAGSSLYDIQSLLSQFFPNTIQVFDNQKMKLDYFFDSSIGSSTLAQIFVKDGRLPRPMGVRLGAIIYIPGIENLFGFRTYEAPGTNVHGFNTYEVYDTGCRWVSYGNVLIP